MRFHRTDGAPEVPFELVDPYRIGEGLGGQRCIFGKPGQLGLTLDEALRAKVLRPVFKPVASTED